MQKENELLKNELKRKMVKIGDIYTGKHFAMYKKIVILFFGLFFISYNSQAMFSGSLRKCMPKKFSPKRSFVSTREDKEGALKFVGACLVGGVVCANIEAYYENKVKEAQNFLGAENRIKLLEQENTSLKKQIEERNG